MIELTPNEFAKMIKHKINYRLCIITETLKRPQLNLFSYSDQKGSWLDQENRILNIDKVISAKASVT
jgi:hypothetical protein